MRIDYGLISLVAVSATSAATNYPASHLALREIERSWRSTDGSAQTVTLDLGSSRVIGALWLQHTNIASATVERSTDNSTWTTVGTLTIHTEQNGRAKGVLLMNATARYLRLTVAGGSPVAGYWFVGSAFVFAASLTLPPALVYGFTHDTIYPIVSRVLANGRPVAARSGPMYSRLSGRFEHFADEDVGVLVRQARASGVIGLDLEVSTRPALKWVSEYVANGYGASLRNVALDEADFELIEVV